jgi:hypothetical protein
MTGGGFKWPCDPHELAAGRFRVVGLEICPYRLLACIEMQYSVLNAGCSFRGRTDRRTVLSPTRSPAISQVVTRCVSYRPVFRFPGLLADACTRWASPWPCSSSADQARGFDVVTRPSSPAMNAPDRRCRGSQVSLKPSTAIASFPPQERIPVIS